MKLNVVHAGMFKLDGGAMFGVVPKAIWNKLNPADEKNRCTWAMRLLLVEIDDRKILIDTGIGDKQPEKFMKHYEPHGEQSIDRSLSELDLTREDITDVFITHLHFDHVGGAIKYDQEGNLIPAFPNATYWSNEKHWAWATDPNPKEKASFLKENILPIKESGKLKFTEDGEELFPGFKVHYAHGHTEALMYVELDYEGKKLFYMADLMPSIYHVPLPFVMAYDVRPLTTLDEKQRFLPEAIEHDYILFLEHDPEVECCTIKQGKKYPEVDETFKLEEVK